MHWSGFIVGALVGVGVAAWAVPQAFASGGADYGGYVAARLLFPPRCSRPAWPATRSRRP
jgi:hypothetical protein